jgi:hypothetical protein
MTQPRHARVSRKAKPARTKTGLSPEAWDRIGRLAVALLDAVAKLIDSISKLH